MCTHPSDTLSHASPLLSSRRTAETLARGKTSSPTTERIVRFRFGLFGNVPLFSRMRPPRPLYRFTAPRSLILRWHRACAPPRWDQTHQECVYRKCAEQCPNGNSDPGGEESGSTMFEYQGRLYERRWYCCNDRALCNSEYAAAAALSSPLPPQFDISLSRHPLLRAPLLPY